MMKKINRFKVRTWNRHYSRLHSMIWMLKEELRLVNVAIREMESLERGRRRPNILEFETDPGKREIKTTKPFIGKAGMHITTHRITKKNFVLSMMSTKGGLTAVQVMKATGWNRNTVRGFMSKVGARRRKVRIGINSYKLLYCLPKGIRKGGKG